MDNEAAAAPRPRTDHPPTGGVTDRRQDGERGPTRFENLSLNTILPLLGWRSEPRTEGSRGKRIFDSAGAFAGQLSATETWDLLVKRGLVQS